MRSLFSELKRRNVLRAGAFYAAAAWLFVQIATQVFPFFDVPNLAVRWVVIAAIIGFPFALAFAWFFEVTPEGLKRESELDRSESITRPTGKIPDRWIIAILALAVALLLANTFVLRSRGPNVDGQAVSAKSIAVLPFVNMSGDPQNEYFSDGITDEILNALAQIPGLKVAARTSAFAFKGKAQDLRKIGDALGVANVLERLQRFVERAPTGQRFNGIRYLWLPAFDPIRDDPRFKAVLKALNVPDQPVKPQAP